MIAIVDYGMGNLRNVQRAFHALGMTSVITDKPEEIRAARRVVLPGVGAFGEAVKRIDARGLRAPIMEQVQRGTPMLGICLGMQLMFEASEETPGHRGLGIFPGTILRFPDSVKVPHIGWNDVETAGPPSILSTAQPRVFYFVHSFYAPVADYAMGLTGYGVEFAAAVRKGNAFGVQFHPEKSQSAGHEVLRSFAAVECVSAA